MRPRQTSNIDSKFPIRNNTNLTYQPRLQNPRQRTLQQRLTPRNLDLIKNTPDIIPHHSRHHKINPILALDKIRA